MFAYVLVKWTTGQDSGKLSVVDRSWVRDVDNIKFTADGFLDGKTGGSDNAEKMVEWHESRKMPIRGWPVSAAQILRASGVCHVCLSS